MFGGAKENVSDLVRNGVSENDVSCLIQVMGEGFDSVVENYNV